MESVNPLKIKCAGGAAAQTLALMNAIYVTQGSNREFTFEFYPYGTGTYWPFEILPALNSREIGNIATLSRGHSNSQESLKVGEIIQSHPINSKRMSLEKFYVFLRKSKIDHLLLALKKEIAINGSAIKLEKVSNATQTISGGYLPILDNTLFESLDKRFKQGGLVSPFGKTKVDDADYKVVIHYRIGDKRAKFKNPGVVGDDGILDPKVIRQLIEKLHLLDSRIMVVSDEPELAKQLLSEVGLSVDIQPRRNNIWVDIDTMAKAKTFIGTWSQVSQLASVCVINRGGIAYLPSNTKGKNRLKWKTDGVEFYAPEFLGPDHYIYF
jgi:hypothetical protein